jgi:hypothetical protein
MTNHDIAALCRRVRNEEMERVLAELEESPENSAAAHRASDILRSHKSFAINPDYSYGASALPDQFQESVAIEALRLTTLDA